MSTVVWPHRTSPFAAATTSRNASTDGASAQRLARKVRIVLAGGGTGGHLYPGLAVAEALERELTATTGGAGGVELIWAATPRAVDQHLLAGFGERYVQQPVQPLVRKISKLWPFWQGWRQSCRYWDHYFAAHSVDGVLALGGYAAGPAAYVASQRGIPIGLLNPDAVPGLANRFLLKRAARVFSQWPLDETLARKMGASGQVCPLGCPIRIALSQCTREEGARRLDLDPACPTLVVCGGSLAAKTINDAIMALLADANVRDGLLGQPASNPGVRGMDDETTTPKHAGAPAVAERWQILHLAGTAQAADVRKAYEPIKDLRWHVLEYCDDMAAVWAVADLALARAGASTCAELLACGVPSILLPYPYHKDQHQRHNAAELVAADAAVMVDDQKDAAANARSIKTPLVWLLYDQQARRKMAQAARAAGKPNAAQDIAREFLALISK
jgi:UDP-N-acetylglucosamine--N-acetylmuramyl-(pentapeptide) pyrophosphoryl-undecaprenol N-acetylglucosamine transferase